MQADNAFRFGEIDRAVCVGPSPLAAESLQTNHFARSQRPKAASPCVLTCAASDGWSPALIWRRPLAAAVIAAVYSINRSADKIEEKAYVVGA